jgi:hypothetical protein
MVEIQIPVKLFLKKYLLKKLGPEPYTINQKLYHGQVLLNYLSTKKQHTKLNIKHTDVYRVTIPSRVVQINRKVTITKENIDSWISWAMGQFKDDFRMFMLSRIDLKKEKKNKIIIQEGILRFCELFEINEQDVPFDMLKKDLQRYMSRWESRTTNTKE